MPETFQEKFCRHFDVPIKRYDKMALRFALYPHARWLCLLGPKHLLNIDRSFVAAVGELTRHRDFLEEVQNFQRHDENRIFWRRTVRLRVSVERMQELFSEVWGKPAPTTANYVR